MGGMAAAVELQEVHLDAVAKEHPQHRRSAVHVLAVVSPRAHHELRFLGRLHDRAVVSSPHRVFDHS
jgi:hypothetical protein